ncbi:MAG: hypothetical protein ACRDWV_07360 [Acidimicrobiales bacterium]
MATGMPHVTVCRGSGGNPVYQVGGKSFVFFRNPRPDATDPQTGQRFDDVIGCAFLGQPNSGPPGSAASSADYSVIQTINVGRGSCGLGIDTAAGTVYVGQVGGMGSLRGIGH